MWLLCLVDFAMPFEFQIGEFFVLFEIENDGLDVRHSVLDVVDPAFEFLVVFAFSLIRCLGPQGGICHTGGATDPNNDGDHLEYAHDFLPFQPFRRGC